MLIILRGPSGSGKSSVARALRLRAAGPCALLEQDYLRRIVLKEKDVSGALNIRLIEQTACLALDSGYDVILEGILDRGRYGEMLSRLVYAVPQGDAHVYYFDVSFEETLRRHATKPNSADFGEVEMRRWWVENDLLGLPGERLIREGLSLDEIVDAILTDTRLDTPEAARQAIAAIADTPAAGPGATSGLG